MSLMIIGHRGAAGLAPENTLASFRAAYEAGVDMIEFDVRLTRDNVPVVIHGTTLYRTHRLVRLVRTLRFADLKKQTANEPVHSLAEVLDAYFGLVLLNIEVKSRGAAGHVVRLLQSHYITEEHDWEKVLISSFKKTELAYIRHRAPRAQLSLLHSYNPFMFVAVHKLLRLTAVGFSTKALNKLAIDIAKKAGIFTYVYTENDPRRIKHYEALGLDGICTDAPDRFIDR